MNIDTKKHKKILSIAIPAALNSLLSMLQVITDLIMVGSISAYAVAAVGLGLQSLMLIFAVLTLLHVGTSALLSRFMGAGNIKRASLGLSSLLRFAFYISIPATLVWYFFTPKLYTWFGTAAEVTALGTSYVQMLTFMVPIIFVKLVFETSFSSAKDTTTPFLIKFISILINIFLNWVLIFGNLGAPALGVEGAAIATVIVNILEFLVYMVLYTTNKMPYKPMWKYSKTLINRVLKVGVPASIERSLTFGSFMLFTMIITNFGTSTLAGYQIGLRVEGIAFMPGIGFTIAAMALMGQGLGAKNPDQSYEDVMLVLKYTVSFMFFLGFFMIFIPEKIVWIFTDDKETIKEASLYLKIVGLSQIPLAVSFVLSGALRGAGDSKRTLKINLTSLWLVRIIPAFVLSYYFQSVLFVYLAMISDTYVKGFLMWRTFQKGEWRKIKV